MGLLSNEMGCIRALAELSGKMAFEPPTMVLQGCEELGYDDWVEQWFGWATWFDFLQPNLERTTAELVGASDTILKQRTDSSAIDEQSLQELLDAHADYHQAIRHNLANLRPAVDGAVPPTAFALEADLIRAEADAIKLTLMLLALSEAPSLESGDGEIEALMEQLAGFPAALSESVALISIEERLTAPLLVVTETAIDGAGLQIDVRNVGDQVSAESTLSIVNRTISETVTIPELAPNDSSSFTVPIEQTSEPQLVRLKLGSGREQTIAIAAQVQADATPDAKPIAAETSSPQPTVPASNAATEPQSNLPQTEQSTQPDNLRWVMGIIVVAIVAIVALLAARHQGYLVGRVANWLWLVPILLLLAGVALLLSGNGSTTSVAEVEQSTTSAESPQATASVPTQTVGTAQQTNQPNITITSSTERNEDLRSTAPVPTDTPLAQVPIRQTSPFDANTAQYLLNAATIGLGIPLNIARSHDADTLLVVTNFGTQLFDTQTLAHKDVLLSHQFGDLDEVSISADGSRAIVVDGNHNAYYWDAVNGEILHRVDTVSSAESFPNSVTISPDGKTYAIANERIQTRDTFIELIDVATSELLATYNAVGDVRTLLFSPDGQWLAAESGAAGIQLLSADTLQPEVNIPTNSGQIDMEFSADSRLFRLLDDSIYIWDIATGQLQIKQPLQRKERFFSCSFDNRYCAVALFDGFDVYDIASGELASSHTLSEGGVGVRFLPDSYHLVVASRDGVNVWDVAQKQPVDELAGFIAWAHSAELSPQDDVIVIGGKGGRLELWDVRTGELVESLVSHEVDISTLVHNADGTLLATLDIENRLILWDTVTKRPQQEYTLDHIPISERFFRTHAQIDFLDDDTLIIAFQDTIQQWDITTQQVTNSLALGTLINQYDRFKLTADNSLLVSAAGEQLVVIDIVSWAIIKTASANGSVTAYAVSADSQTLVAASTNRTSTPSSQTLRTYSFPDLLFQSEVEMVTSSDGIDTLTYLNGGDLLAFGQSGRYGDLYLYHDVGMADVTQQYKSHRGFINYSAFSANDTLLVTGFLDGTIKIWTADQARYADIVPTPKPPEQPTPLALAVENETTFITKTITLNASADTYLSEFSASENYGDADKMLLGVDSDGWRYDVLLWFDLFDEIPEGARIVNAEVGLVTDDAPFTPLQITILPTSLWDEERATWETYDDPYYYAPSYAIDHELGLDDGINWFDVTELASAWMADDLPNWGLRITSSSIMNVRILQTRDANPADSSILKLTYEIDEQLLENSVASTAANAPLRQFLTNEEPGNDTPEVAVQVTLEPQATMPPLALSDDTFVVGMSAGNRPIIAHRFGTGETTLILVGGIHGGFAPSGVQVADNARDYFTNNPTAIPENVTVYIISNANPDSGNQAGSVQGRLNANGVDLNRNWGCNWQPTSTFGGGSQTVSGGTAAFSEPETVALRDFFLEVKPAAVIFYEARASEGRVYMSNCFDNLGGSRQLSDAFRSGSGYSTAGSVAMGDGEAGDWLASQDVPAIFVLLPTSDSVTSQEWQRNLDGIMSVIEFYSP